MYSNLKKIPIDKRIKIITININNLYITPKINRKIPIHERYETIDFTPKQNIVNKSSLLNGIKNNKIPLHERYETIDFSPRK